LYLVEIPKIQIYRKILLKVIIEYDWSVLTALRKVTHIINVCDWFILPALIIR